MRLVLDTNTLVSALFWDGNERQVLRKCKNKEHQLIVSPQILDELTEVLKVKFHVPDDRIKEYIEELILIAEIVHPVGEIHVVKEDPDDDIILETAVVGKVDMLVTGDKNLLKIKDYRGIVIDRSRKLLSD
jgi:putative PIN family toxin of toxin-antitoxin system